MIHVPEIWMPRHPHVHLVERAECMPLGTGQRSLAHIQSGAPPPPTAPAATGRMAWFRGDTTTYVNELGTNFVTQWTDRIGTKHVDGSGTSRPKWSSSVRGLPALEFDRVTTNKKLVGLATSNYVYAPSAGGPAESFMYSVVEIRSIVSTNPDSSAWLPEAIWSDASGFTQLGLVTAPTSGVSDGVPRALPYWYGATPYPRPTIILNQRILLTWKYAAGKFGARVNNSAFTELSSTAGCPLTAAFQIGCGQSGTAMDGYVWEQFCATASTDDAENLAYFNGRYSLW